jgi:DNA-binding NarL/FixJ family response regulator
MQAAHGPEQAELPPELASVAEAAAHRLRAETDGDDDATIAGAQSLLEAATSALNAGYSLAEITQAEARGKSDLRDSLREGILQNVEHTGQRVNEAQSEHREAIARAVRLGLSARQIAAAAGVTHGTVRAIMNRMGTEPPPDETPGESGESLDEHHHEQEGDFGG